LKTKGEEKFSPLYTTQFAFTKRRNGLQLILLLRVLIEQCDEWHIPVVIASGDVWKAYDRMKHPWLAEVLKRRRVHLAVIAAWLRLLRGSSYTHVLDHATSSGPLHNTCGLDQGDPSGPKQFVVGLDEILRPLTDKWVVQRRGIGLDDELIVTHVNFADNIWVISGSSEDCRSNEDCRKSAQRSVSLVGASNWTTFLGVPHPFVSRPIWRKPSTLEAEASR
jgi:hypothetical protein